jgi:formylglycine-generating enzyme required for sulfatase activity
VPAFALGALAVLGVAGLGTSLVATFRPGTTAKRNTSIMSDKPAADARADAVAKSRPSSLKPATVSTNSIGMRLALIPAGEFVMGSPVLEEDADASETPQHRVTISRPFHLGVTEVTQGQYRAVTGKSPSKFQGSDDLPAEQVSWYDAVAFCNALSAKEGHTPYYRIEGRKVEVFERDATGYRLPTEAEWEYACRAGTTGRYHFGSDAETIDLYAWHAKNSHERSHPVGQKRANNFGLFDMHGNLWEWCGDWLSANYYKESPVIDPAGPSKGGRCVYRGGSWNHDPRDCRSATRHNIPPERQDSRLGFRVALTPFNH